MKIILAVLISLFLNISLFAGNNFPSPACVDAVNVYNELVQNPNIGYGNDSDKPEEFYAIGAVGMMMREICEYSRYAAPAYQHSTQAIKRPNTSNGIEKIANFEKYLSESKRIDSVRSSGNFNYMQILPSPNYAAAWAAKYFQSAIETIRTIPAGTAAYKADLNDNFSKKRLACGNIAMAIGGAHYAREITYGNGKIKLSKNFAKLIEFIRPENMKEAIEYCGFYEFQNKR